MIAVEEALAMAVEFQRRPSTPFFSPPSRFLSPSSSLSLALDSGGAICGVVVSFLPSPLLSSSLLLPVLPFSDFFSFVCVS
ncbi:uncharacterized protein DS421_8g248920 [Arachis hypogaea]|nr:uncharacterized protein DS421_8g248920 [Arachis hypogaea]